MLAAVLVAVQEHRRFGEDSGLSTLFDDGCQVAQEVGNLLRNRRTRLGAGQVNVRQRRLLQRLARHAVELARVGKDTLTGLEHVDGDLLRIPVERDQAATEER